MKKRKEYNKTWCHRCKRDVNISGLVGKKCKHCNDIYCSECKDFIKGVCGECRILFNLK